MQGECQPYVSVINARHSNANRRGLVSGSRGGSGGSVEPPKLTQQTSKTVRFLKKIH